MAVIQKLKDEVRGPLRVYMNTDRVDDYGNPIMDPDTGKKEELLVLEKVYYRPNFITPKLEAELRAMTDDKEKNSPVAQSADLMLKIVTSWDCYLTEEDQQAGRSVPLTTEGLKDVPVSLIVAVVTACTEGVRPPKAPPEKSQSSFSREADGANSTRNTS